jgi:hypothetical protein
MFVVRKRRRKTPASRRDGPELKNGCCFPANATSTSEPSENNRWMTQCQSYDTAANGPSTVKQTERSTFLAFVGRR